MTTNDKTIYVYIWRIYVLDDTKRDYNTTIRDYKSFKDAYQDHITERYSDLALIKRPIFKHFDEVGSCYIDGDLYGDSKNTFQDKTDVPSDKLREIDDYFIDLKKGATNV